MWRAGVRPRTGWRLSAPRGSRHPGSNYSGCVSEHLWGAYCISGRRIGDLQTFLGLSEEVRVWGQTWRRKARRAQPLFGNDLWVPPEGWRHPDPDWPERIKIPRYDLPSLGVRTPAWMLPK